MHKNPADPADPIAAALSQLISDRDDHLAQASRLSEAITALEAVRGPGEDGPATAGSRPSVRMMMMQLVNEENRDWSTAEILTEYQHRGTPIHGKDPNNALRAAIADAYKAGQIARTTTGRYKATKWADSTSLLDSPPWASDQKKAVIVPKT